MRSRFPAALDSMAHRGPDGSGVFQDGPVLLGHRRLAILDLSASGAQPMVDPDTGCVIVFNGEIYNYLEIRSELESRGVEFRSRSDTEVLLKAWLYWGEGALPRLNGMWAFAIWDPRTREIFLCRDRFGVKPLYWACKDRMMLFASEPKAMFRMAPSLAKPSQDAIWRFMVSSESHTGAESFFEAVKAIPPGHYARISVDFPDLKTWPYWEYPSPDGSHLSRQQLDEEFSYLLEDAVRLRLRSDVPVGITLSGGLDSTAVLAAGQKLLDRPITCFTSVYEDDAGEESWARLAAESAGARLESVVAEQADWLPMLEKIVWHMDSPGFSPAVFPLWAIMKHARETGIPVLLEGQGADELLAGYPQYAALAILFGASRESGRLAMLSSLTRSAGLRWSALWLARQGLENFTQQMGPRAERERLMRCRSTYPGAPRLPAGLTDRMRQELHRDHALAILPPLLHYGDAVSMAHGIESRLPFMDYRLVEHMYRRMPEMFDAGLSKGPLRRFLRAHGQDRIAARRDKRGYPTPIIKWISRERETFLDLLHNVSEPVWEYVEPSGIHQLLRGALRGDYADAFHCYKFLTLAIWLRQCERQRRVEFNSAIRTAEAA